MPVNSAFAMAALVGFGLGTVVPPVLERAGRVLTRGQLIDRVWGADYFGDTKTLDVHIKRIRSKIETMPSEPPSTSSGRARPGTRC